MSTSRCIESPKSHLHMTPFKKRIRQIENKHTDKIGNSNMTENIMTDEGVTNYMQEIHIKFSPTKENKIDEKTLKVETVSNTPTKKNICGGKEIKENDNVQNNLRSQNVSPMTVKNIHSISKANDSLHNCDSSNCDNKIDDNSADDKNIFSLCLKEMQDLLKTPPCKKTEPLLQSDNIVSSDRNLEKRKNDDDYKQFCDTLKSELYNSENCNDFGAVDLLYNDLLNTRVNIEDSKVSSDILLSSIADMNTLQYIDEGLADFNKDPLTDPLFINDHEEKDVDSIFDTDLDCKPVALRRSSRIHKSPIGDYNVDDIKKHKLNIEEKHILKELENIEEEELPLNTIQQLASLNIELVHKVPPQHKIETRAGTHTTTNEKILFQKYGPLRKGPFTYTEDKTIAQNWDMFCKLHNWDSKNLEPFLNWRYDGKYYIHNLKERQKFVQFLANGLPWRTLFSVYSRFRILYRNKITNTRYTSKEDQKILTYIQSKHLDQRDTKYMELAKLLGRTSRSISKRYKYLKRVLNEPVKKLKVKWTVPLIRKFIKTLLNVTLSENIEELKHVTLPMPVWQKMEEKLHIDENVLKTFWQHQLHLQLFSTNSIYLNDIKIQLIEYIYKKGISSTREIIWPNVAQYFDGATAVFLCKIFFYLVQECDMNDTENFADIVEYLYHKKIPEIKDAPTDKFLPRIVYKNGKIDVLNSEDDATDTNTADCEADCDTDDV
ncbi:PREDICTED: uncharacterized protein LOC106745027 [Dinoponera quadriceps]|uniref:Uncharacterized protein LOC106745027 n=1 Tax=Dinoponera quadriceps TaxID=609295 RepID=A0A6P3XBQ6_DINQU|nr:PREDICTED: uncharacterized protein LOC106745027 [Dinoponera quadriceps]